MYSTTLSLTSALRWRWVVNAMPRSLNPWERDQLPIVQGAGWASQPLRTSAQNLAPTRIIPAPSSHIFRHYSCKTTNNNIGFLTDVPSSLFASCFVNPAVCTNIKPMNGFFMLFDFNDFHNKSSSPLNCLLNKIIMATTLYKERHKFIQQRIFPSLLTAPSFSDPSSALSKFLSRLNLVLLLGNENIKQETLGGAHHTFCVHYTYIPNLSK